jgi:hypothetical protein
MLALVEAQNAATLARSNDARLAGHRDVLAAFYDSDSGDIDAHVYSLAIQNGDYQYPYRAWRGGTRQDHRRRW